MAKLDVQVAVILSISVASGLSAGLFAVRYFDAETVVHRLFVFWPVFWVVGVVVFFGCALLAAWMFGSN
jgi:hypothetical protein